MTLVDPYIGKQDTTWRKAIDTPRRLGVFLNYLAHGKSYGQLGEQFGISKPSVSHIIEEVSETLVYIFKDLQADARFPSNPTDIKALQAGFREIWGLPGAVGAIDGSHFAILRPTANGEDYLNRKKYYSVVGLFVANAACYCVDFVVGWPGGVHDARVWRNMALKDRLEGGQVPLRTMEKIEVRSTTPPPPFFLPPSCTHLSPSSFNCRWRTARSLTTS